MIDTIFTLLHIYKQFSITSCQQMFDVDDSIRKSIFVYLYTYTGAI